MKAPAADDVEVGERVAILADEDSRTTARAPLREDRHDGRRHPLDDLDRFNSASRTCGSAARDEVAASQHATQSSAR